MAACVGVPATAAVSTVVVDGKALALYSERVGYVQHIDMAALQKCAEELQIRIVVAALPGTFAALITSDIVLMPSLQMMSSFCQNLVMGMSFSYTPFSLYTSVLKQP